MNADYKLGRINFGPRSSYTTLGALIDDIAADEELIEDLCLMLGNQLTELLDLKDRVREAGCEL